MSKTVSIVIVVIVLCLLCGGIGYMGGVHFGRSSASASSEPSDKDAAAGDEPKATASVQVVAIQSGQVTRSIVAYGTVMAQASNVQVFSVPFESRVVRLAVAAGAKVDKDTQLIEMEPSPDARLQYGEAQVAMESAQKDLEQTQQRFNSKLATNSDMLLAQQALAVAKLHLQNLEMRGVNATQPSTLIATAPGVASKIDVQVGQIVPAGQALVETVALNEIEVRVGVEPDEAARLQTGQGVKLHPVGDAETTMDGKIRLVAQRVNPDTRLVDVFVTPAEQNLLLDGYVRCQWSETSPAGLVVPRSAVLPDDEGNLVYTVKDGHAVKHVVTIGFEGNDQTLISGEGLTAGDIAVTLGNYELEDQMSVAILAPPEAPATEPTTEPTTAPTTEPGQ